MTKVQIRFRLQSALSEAQRSRLAEAHAVYGVQRIQVEEPGASLTVEYDASRLRPEEVEAVLRRAGVAAVREP